MFSGSQVCFSIWVVCTFPCKGEKEKKGLWALRSFPGPSFYLHRSDASFLTGFLILFKHQPLPHFHCCAVCIPATNASTTYQCDSPTIYWLASKSAEYFLDNKFSRFSKWPLFPLSFNSHSRKTRVKRKPRLLKIQCELIVRETYKKLFLFPYLLCCCCCRIFKINILVLMNGRGNV